MGSVWGPCPHSSFSLDFGAGKEEGPSGHASENLGAVRPSSEPQCPLLSKGSVKPRLPRTRVLARLRDPSPPSRARSNRRAMEGSPLGRGEGSRAPQPLPDPSAPGQRAVCAPFLHVLGSFTNPRGRRSTWNPKGPQHPESRPCREAVPGSGAAGPFASAPRAQRGARAASVPRARQGHEAGPAGDGRVPQWRPAACSVVWETLQERGPGAGDLPTPC